MRQFPILVVRVILEDVKGRILLLCRSGNENYGRDEYCLPGGKVDYGKTVEEACLDEIKEETHLEITNLRFLFYQDNLPTIIKGLHVINFYFFADYYGEVQINSESSSSVWVHPQNLSGYKIAFRNDEAIRQYLKIKNSGNVH